jgi:hypothetical protein
MPGYQTRQDRIAVHGARSLLIRSLRDRLQYADPYKPPPPESPTPPGLCLV